VGHNVPRASLDSSVLTGRVFWRAWFDADRVGLEASRRDYLEYKFGTVVSTSARNYFLGGMFGIPYYIFVGCPKHLTTSGTDSPRHSQELLERLDAAFTESPYLSPANHQRELHNAVEKNVPPEIRSKAFESAVINLATDLPLPSAFYQNHHWRIFYNDLLQKHTQFRDEYIYAFNWEDPRVDQRLLNIGSDDVILTITSAGDNILDYLQYNPRRIHAVDLNPAQNHLLELKVACFTSLEYADVWKIFGDGKHPNFRELLVSKISPHLSSQALQYWLDHADIFSSRRCRGLYETGGTRIAIKLVRVLLKCAGLAGEVKRLCSAGTLNEQREAWPRIRRVLMSKPLFWSIIATEWFAWKAAGVPPAQRRLIQQDYLNESGLDGESVPLSSVSGLAMWNYVVNTLDPVVQSTLISNDNYFYLLCLQGKYSRR
jgi:betaine lipid synthase